jgi:hypothetical protein
MHERHLLQRRRLRQQEAQRQHLLLRQRMPERKLRRRLLLQHGLRLELRRLQRVRRPRNLHGRTFRIDRQPKLLALCVQRDERQLPRILHHRRQLFDRLFLQRRRLRREEDQRVDLQRRERVPERLLRRRVLLQWRLQRKLQRLQPEREPRQLHQRQRRFRWRAELLSLCMQRNQRELSQLVQR